MCWLLVDKSDASQLILNIQQPKLHPTAATWCNTAVSAASKRQDGPVAAQGSPAMATTAAPAPARTSEGPGQLGVSLAMGNRRWRASSWVYHLVRALLVTP